MVGQDAVDLLGHRAVERAHPGLHVRQRKVPPGGGERPGQRRVGVAVDEHELGRRVLEHRLERVHHARGLGGVRSARDAELAVGRGNAQLAHEHRGELVVVVLAGVDQHLLVAFAQGARHGGRLDELRPVADDGQDPQRVCSSAASSASIRARRP